MYRKLSLELLVPHPENANRMSRTYAKKLRHGIEQIGRYEIITVRPHPTQDGKFEVLNGHSRLEALRALGIGEARCDIWDVTDSPARLFLAILNKLRGSEVPELRMNLLSGLQRRPICTGAGFSNVVEAPADPSPERVGLGANVAPARAELSVAG